MTVFISGFSTFLQMPILCLYFEYPKYALSGCFNILISSSKIYSQWSTLLALSQCTAFPCALDFFFSCLQVHLKSGDFLKFNFIQLFDIPPTPFSHYPSLTNDFVLIWCPEPPRHNQFHIGNSSITLCWHLDYYN